MGDLKAVEFVYCTTGSSRINDYGEELLKLVLGKTDDKHSLTRINQSTRNHKRLVMEFDRNQSPCSVLIISSENNRYKEKMRMVPIPLTKGLLRSRVFVYTEGISSNWQETSTFEEIKSGFTIGSGSDWSSSRLLRNEGFFVIHGHSINTLWRMLHGGRFDLFHRGIYEAYDEKNNKQH